MLKKLREILKAHENPMHFLTSDYFLNIKPFPKQAEIFDEFYRKKYNELVLIAGMRSGKTTLAAMFALYEAFQLLIYRDPAEHYGLLPGQDVFIICTAPSEEQAADTIFAQIQALIERSPFFKDIGYKQYKLEIQFPSKHVNIFAGSSSSATLVGRSAKCVIFDEIVRFEQTEGKRGAWMVYQSLSRATQTFGGDGHRIVISSPLHINDIIMELSRRATKHTLVRKYATWEFNPKIRFEELENEMQHDPVSFWRDFGAEPMASLSPYFPDGVVLDDLPNVFENQQFSGNSHSYVLACDPAVKNDSFGIALGHRENETIIIDGCWKFTPTKKREVSPLEIRQFIQSILERFNVSYCIFDTHMFPELQEWLRAKGIVVLQHIVKKEDYDRFKELRYYNKVKLPNYYPLKVELEQLQVIDARKIDHVKGGSKDIADAVMNCIWKLHETQMMKINPIVIQPI